ncbi:MAG: hypothetical protein NC337_03275 [Roseburia sp.]|nr:hypothetical protein [Roseburia sp.]
MGRRETERRLRQYAADCERLVPRGRERKITELSARAVLRTRGSLWSFVLEQTGYLGRYCLIWQALWLALFRLLLRYFIPQLGGDESEKRLLIMVSLLPPLLVLLTVEEITKIYQKSMLEIEYATKYSLRSVVLVRMSALCAFHAALLAGSILLLHTRLDSGTAQLLVYGFTPMIGMTGALLKLMQHYKGELLRGAAAGVYGLVLVLALVGGTERFGWYRPMYFRGWCMVGLAGLVFAGWQFVRLSAKLSDFEQCED